jgi:hypothetical protein
MLIAVRAAKADVHAAAFQPQSALSRKACIACIVVAIAHYAVCRKARTTRQRRSDTVSDTDGDKLDRRCFEIYLCREHMRIG